MSNSTVTGVAGTDGVVPVYEPNARWCLWGINDIYTGTIGQGKYVPKVNDYVIDPSTFTTYIVRLVDPMTLVATLEEIRPANMSFSLTETDVLFGVGPGTQSDTYRMYVDTSVVPSVIDVDARLKVGGSMADHAQIFLGTDCSSTGIVISHMYDASGNFLTNNVPLELIAIDSHVNYSIKKVGTCYTNRNLKDGEVVTVVLYAADGHVISKRQCLVENTAFIRQANASQRFITSINLESPFLSPTVPNLIEFPLNVPITAMNLMGVVNYSDGSSVRLPVDGRKFSVLGLEQYVSTIVGQKFDLVLSYLLDADESVYGAVSSNNKYVTEPYYLRTINPNNSYSVKLFGYPVWVSQAIGYLMRWYLFNLDRNVFFDVTNQVNFASNTGPFDPKGYGYLQRKAVQINLQDVSGAFKPFVHTEVADIVLNGMPTSGGTPWTTRDGASSTDVAYGTGLSASLDQMVPNTVNLASGFASQADWLNALYYNTYPLIDPVLETTPPAPSHFVINFNGMDVTVPVDQWNQNITLSGIPAVGNTLFIRFIKQMPTSDLELSMAAMMILQ